MSTLFHAFHVNLCFKSFSILGCGGSSGGEGLTRIDEALCSGSSPVRAIAKLWKLNRCCSQDDGHCITSKSFELQRDFTELQQKLNQ